MMGKLLIILFSIFIFSGCACSTKNEVQPETANNSISTETPQVQRENSIVKSDLSEYVVDLSEFENDKIIIINSDEDIKSIKDQFSQIAREKADPETGDLTGVYAPIHAVVTMGSTDDIKRVQNVFSSVGQKVSTFEIRISKNFINSSQMEVELQFPISSCRRVIVSGEGDSPVEMGLLSFSLYADVVQINNLSWSNTPFLSSKINVFVSTLFEAKNIVIKDNYILKLKDNSNNRGISASRPSVGARPAPVSLGVIPQPQSSSFIKLSSISKDGDKHPKYVIEDVVAENNDVVSLLEIVKDSRNKFSNAYIKNVKLLNNKFKYGFDISVSESVKIDSIISNNTDGYVFTQLTPNASVKFYNTEKQENLYIYNSENEGLTPSVEFL